MPSAHFPLRLSFVLLIYRYLYRACSFPQTPLPSEQLHFWGHSNHHASFLFRPEKYRLPKYTCLLSGLLSVIQYLCAD